MSTQPISSQQYETLANEVADMPIASEGNHPEQREVLARVAARLSSSDNDSDKWLANYITILSDPNGLAYFPALKNTVVLMLKDRMRETEPPSGGRHRKTHRGRKTPHKTRKLRKLRRGKNGPGFSQS